jgi:UbiD family decarboxylase
MPHDLHEYLELLEREKELATIDVEVDPTLEIAEIHRRVVARKGPALLFKKVKGSPFPVVTNLFGSEKRLELALPARPEQFIAELVHLATHLPSGLGQLWEERKTFSKLLSIGTKSRKECPLQECSLSDVSSLPLLQCYSNDAGHFITLGMSYTESPLTHQPNLGMYRMQRFEAKKLGFHAQIGKGGGFHYTEAETLGIPLPVTTFLGGPPALILSSIMPLPEYVSELAFASLLLGEHLAITPHSPHALISSCDFAIIGHLNPAERMLEGPFGDHYGNYGKAHKYPLVHVDEVLHRKDAIYPATCVGRGIGEDYYIGNMLQKLAEPLTSLFMPQVSALWSYGEAGFHQVAAARVRERYEKEALAAAFSILGQGQLSLTKCLFLTDQPVDVTSFKSVLEAILARMCPETDLVVFGNTSADTLDYSGPKVNLGAKAIFLGVGTEKRNLPEEFTGLRPFYISQSRVFTKGSLLIQGPSYEDVPDPSSILNAASFAAWPLLILLDDERPLPTTEAELLSELFVRFDPGQDIYSKTKAIRRNGVSFGMPLLLDARTKPGFPPLVSPDEATQQLVDSRWNHYSPSL